MTHMKPVDILYLVEHVARELDIACLMKYLCETRHGLSVQVASMPFDAQRVADTVAPRMVVTPYLYSAEDAYLSHIIPRWRNVAYFNLCFEQVLFRFQSEQLPRDDFARQQAYHHSWSRAFRDRLVEHGVAADRIFANGNLSYMLYLEPYRRFFPERSVLAERHGLDVERPWIFFPMNYFWAFLSDGRLYGEIANGFDARIAFENRDFSRRSLEAMVEWWSVAASSTCAELIVRPRPAVPHHAYVDYFEKTVGAVPARVHIIKDGTVREWILTSDAVMSSFSTTLLEAAVAGKPAYALEPLAFPEWQYADWLELVPHITQHDEFVAVCQDPRNVSYGEQARQWAMGELLSNGDALANLAELLASLSASLTGQPVYVPPPAEHAGRQRVSASAFYWALRQRARNLLVALGLKDPEARAINMHEDDAFTEDDVAVRVARWAQALDA